MRRSRLALLVAGLVLAVVALWLAIGRGPAGTIEPTTSATIATQPTAGEPQASEIDSGMPASAREASAPSAPVPMAAAATTEHIGRTVEDPNLGDRVTGRVQWPDGRPALGCTIHVETRILSSMPNVKWITLESAGKGVPCKPDGSFEILATEGQSLALTARTDSPSGFAHLSDVQPGASGIVMILQPGRSVTGRAVDDRGDAIAKFTVFAGAREKPLDHLTSPGEGGRFALGGLHDGSWEIYAEAEGHSRSTVHRSDLPGDEAIEFILPRCAKVAGNVQLPNGDAAPEARARSYKPDSLDTEALEDERTGARTDSQGAFVLENLDAGPQEIVGSKPEFANSEPAALDLRPGDSVRGLVLKLQRGGSIVGEVLDSAGKPLPKRTVDLHCVKSKVSRDLVSDESGRFRIDALAAGHYRLMLMPFDEADARAPTPAEMSAATNSILQSIVSADVLDGETTHVTIGGVKGGIRVHGVVALGASEGKRLRYGSLTFHREGDDIPGRACRTDDRGQYEIFVDGDGTYVVLVDCEPNAPFPGMGIHFIERVRIPSGQEFTYDIALPDGSISGRVVRADGAPASGIQLILEPEERTAQLSSSASAGFRNTNESGEFMFDGLKAGTYRITTGLFSADDPPGSGTAEKPDIALADGQHLEGVEIRLQPAARMEGLVTGPDGKPFPGAVIFVRDESGSLVVRTYPPPSTDPSGRFTIEGLTPGKVIVGARTEHLVTVETPHVTLGPGETPRVTLALQPGTVLHVLVQESSGKFVGASLRVVDERGQQVGAAYPFGRDENGNPVSPDAGVRIGPVPPGRYKITATNHDLASTSRDISVSGDEQTVTLKFGE